MVRFSWLVALVGLALVPALQQDVVLIRDATCSECRISVERIARVGARSGDGSLVNVESITVDSRGRYYITTSLPSHSVFVFDTLGKHVVTIGKEGGGPGEYRGISFAVPGMGDSLHIFDTPNRRRSVLTPDFEFAYQTPFSGRVYDARRLAGGRQLVLSGRFRTPENVGYPHHVFYRDGTVRSFGADTAIERPDMMYWNMRSLAVGSQGVWSGHRQQYVIDLWGYDLRRKKRLIRNVAWFAPYLRPARMSEGKPPEPELSALSDDGRYLWTYTLVADKEWKSALERRPGAHGDVEGIGRINDYLDTIIEVIDYHRGVVVKSVRVDRAVITVLENGLVAAVHQDDDDLGYADIWRVRLTGNPSSN